MDLNIILFQRSLESRDRTTNSSCRKRSLVLTEIVWLNCRPTGLHMLKINGIIGTVTHCLIAKRKHVSTFFFFFFFFLDSLGGVRLSPLGTSAIVGLLYQPRMIDDDDYGAVGGMRIGSGNRSTRIKPAPVPLCPAQIPHDLGSNPGRRGGKPATNRLSYGTALFQHCSGLYGSPKHWIIFKTNDIDCKTLNTARL
jgi:hypothetical protein